MTFRFLLLVCGVTLFFSSTFALPVSEKEDSLLAFFNQESTHETHDTQGLSERGCTKAQCASPRTKNCFTVDGKLYFRDPKNPKFCAKKRQRRRCCRAMTSTCLACRKGVSVKEFCKRSRGKYGCPKPKQIEPKPEGPKMCCKAMTPSCLACSKGVSVEEYCETNPGKYGCPKPKPIKKPIKLLETTHETQGLSKELREEVKKEVKKEVKREVRKLVKKEARRFS